ncbi:hypothetical protein Syun_030881 [Stephania yunnanensis]|uniref:Coclaurine N-methyltransferase n=1 Tax=Stephania yunnanensis TaxID=152371 RepID=A0AAP0DZI8_9MAGN
MEAKQGKKDELKSKVAELLERPELGLVPDEEIRRLAKARLEKRLKWGYKPTHEEQLSNLLQFVHSLPSLNMASEDDSPKAWLYETPTSFLQLIYGDIIKESGSYYNDESSTLEEAMIHNMDLCCERASIREAHSVLDLGCGYGAFILHVAQKYKTCNVTGITSSISQKNYIIEQCKKLNLSNVEVILADVATIKLDTTFDRVFAAGMFEHINDYKSFLRKISKWMKPDGLLFVEHLCNKTFPYQNKPLDDGDNWGEYVFPSGGLIIPSASLLLYFQEDVSIVNHWTFSGKHAANKFEELLKRIDAKIEAIKGIFNECYGSKDAVRFINYWRVFLITAAEMFGYNNGEEWIGVHVLFKKK